MPEPEAAVTLVHAAPPCDSVLLMRRAERAGDSWSGHWSLPGGHREPGDVDLLHTALGEMATILDPAEAARADWVPLSLLRDTSRHQLRNVPNGAADLFFPAVDLDVAPLWGFTWRVLVEWLNLGPRQEIAAVADSLLDFVTAHGCSLEHGWNAGTARVRGRIPAEAAIARFAQPGPHIFAILKIEIRPDRIRLTDPAMREF